MGLSSVNIKNLKKLSLKGVTLPTPDQSRMAVKELVNSEDIIYSKLLRKNPIIESLVEKLDLVSTKTGEPFKKTSIEVSESIPVKKDNRPIEKAPINRNDGIKHQKLLSLAKEIIPESESFSEGKIINGIQEKTNVDEQRAKNGFNLMKDFKVINEVPGKDLFYLTGSTPF